MADQGSSVALSHGASARSVTPKRPAHGPTEPIAEAVASGVTGPARELALRREFEDGSEGAVTISSFGQHRRQRSVSREPSSLCNSLTPEGTIDHKSTDQTTLPYRPLETVKEVASTANTPNWPLTAMKVEGQHLVDEKQVALDLEKRLPTLPNTPSSAYPPSIAEEPETKDDSNDLANLHSHFSATTIGSESCTDSFIRNDRSRFSDWTCGTTRISPSSHCASSFVDFEPMSPPLESEFDFGETMPIKVADEAGDGSETKDEGCSAFNQDGLPSAFSFSTVSSVASSATPNAHVNLDSAVDADFSWSKFQHYSLPSEEIGSGATLKPAPTNEHVAPLIVDEHNRPGVFQPQIGTQDGSAIPHSTSMRQLLDELSYLGGMIQHN